MHFSLKFPPAFALCREAGLFPPQDAFLTSLIEEANTFPFEKHQAGLKSRYEVLPKGGWTTGNEAAENGLDMRLFWKVGDAQTLCGTL